VRSPRRLRAVALGILLTLAACASPSAAPSSPSATSAGSSSSPTATGAGSPSTKPTSTAAASVAVTTYVVQGGDTLFGIARRFGATPGQLQAWNVARFPSLVDDPGTLEAGWELVVAQQPGVTPQPTVPATPPATPRPSVPPPVGDLPCRAGNRAGGGIATYARIPNAGNEVALTFDMGGRLDPALDIMAFLVANKVCATIFATGAMSSTPIGQQVLAIIRAHPGQFEIANHTMAHCDLVRGGGGSPTTGPCVTGGPPTASFIRTQLTDAEAILRAGTGQDPQPYWRPPYGSVNAAVTAAAASVGYTKTFLWDIDTIDWKPASDGGPSAQQIAAKVITNAQGGSNVLFHLGGYNTLDAVKLIVPGLRQRGLIVSSLSDLLDGG
jgi:peptidoglycan/xylan/chitin deacetylase (PgdA/CDA1 family)/LysM repeat protein